MLRDISEIQKLATKYSKPQLARMAQMGLIDPTKAVMAGMMIDRITKSNMQPPQTTVADEALMPMQPPNQPMQPPAAPPMQQAQPPVAPAGIGSLPTQPEPNAGVAALPSGITEMAEGGIVAFDEGGYVPRYGGNDPVAGSLVDQSMFSPTAQIDPNVRLREIKAEEERQRQQQEKQNKINASFATGFNALDMRARDEMVSNVRRKMQNNLPLSPTENNLLSNVPEFKSLVDRDIAKNPTSVVSQTTSPSTFQATEPRPDTTQMRQPEARAARPGTRQGPGVPRTTVEQPSGLQSIKPPDAFVMDPNVGKFETERYKPVEKKELKDFLRQQEEAERAAGVNTNIYKDLMGELEGKKGKLANRKQEAIGTALMQTGLGLLGARRGQEFAVLGEAGQRSLLGLVAANERIRETEDKLDDARRNLLMSENDYKRTRSDKALEKVERNTDKIEQLEIRNVDNKNAANQAQAKISVDLQGQRVQARAQDVQQYGYQLQSQTSLETERMRGKTTLDAERIRAATANRPSDRQRINTEYNNILKTQGPEAAEKYMQLQERIGGGKAQSSVAAIADKAHDNVVNRMKDDFKLQQKLSDPAAFDAAVAAEQKRLMAAYRQQDNTNSPGGSLKPNPNGTFDYQPGK
jgi:hypothetical protein